MPGATRLTLYVALSWAALAAYASLYPFSGWHDSGADPWDFLFAAWPRHYTGFDLVANVAAYAPLGFFGYLALRRSPRLGSWPALVLATLAGLLLSGTLEVLQNYLPSRVASNLDLACNSSGTLIGALAGLRWGKGMFGRGRLEHFRSLWFTHRHGVDSGLLLMGLWLITQLDPGTIAFGTGDLRQLLELPAAQPFSAERFRAIETVVATSGLLSALALGSLLAAPARRGTLPVLWLGLALALKTLAHALMLTPAGALAWATPGTLTGIALAVLLWVLTAQLGAAVLQALAASSLLLATAVVNLAPGNPYLENALQVWNPGQFLNFHGLTQFIASVWPFLALPWLMLMRSPRP